VGDMGVYTMLQQNNKWVATFQSTMRFFSQRKKKKQKKNSFFIVFCDKIGKFAVQNRNPKKKRRKVD
jgi:hypothetical protein